MSLYDDINELLEGFFLSQWQLIETYHAIGTRILKEEKDPTPICADLAQRFNRSKRTFLYATKFAQVFPKLDSALPEGKNITWNKIVTKYLTTSKDQPTHDCEPITVCKICKKPL